MKHTLKCWPAYFEAIEHGIKTFDVRKNDRGVMGFAVGDTLTFEEWHPGAKEYTGNVSAGWRVCYVLRDFPGIEPGYCVMGIER